ncbi:MAG: signal peptide peptidase SppA [Nitrospiria bacterium]
MGRKPLLTGLLIFLAVGIFLFLSVYLATFMVEKGSLGDERIALVRIEGIILDSKETLEEITHYNENPSIKAIVLRIDSPGGAVVPSQEIYEEVKRIRAESKKKVVVSMGTVAASGGYYIASASDRIVANPGTLTGSIGVIMELANFAGLLEKIGVESTVVKSGRHKDIGSPFRRMGAEEREILQNVLDDVHNQFIEAVSEARGLEIGRVRGLADGRIFTGRQAMELGLVDDLGGLQDTIRMTAEMVGIKGKPRIVETRKRFSILELLRNRWLGSLAQSFNQPRGTISLQYLLAF